MAEHNTYERIVDRAIRTGGGCRRDQLLLDGVTSSAIDRQVAVGAIKRVGRGIYLVPALRGEATDLWIAVLSVPGAVVSRESAARLHRFPLAGNGIHVTAKKGVGRAVAGVTVHETRQLRREDVVAVDGLPVTSAARTLLDLAGELRRDRLRHLVSTQIVAGNPTAELLVAAVRARSRPGVPGLRKMRWALLGLVGDVPFDESELERRVRRGLVQYRIPGFHREFRPPWFDGRRGIVDFAHAGARVVVEADGRQWHAAEQAMVEDRRRDRQAVAAGWVVLRVSWHEIAARPAATFDEIRSVVEDRQQRLAA